MYTSRFVWLVDAELRTTSKAFTVNKEYFAWMDTNESYSKKLHDSAY